MKSLTIFCWLDKRFLPELHSRQPRFTYSACELFTKHYEKIQKCKKTRESNVSIKTN